MRSSRPFVPCAGGCLSTETIAYPLCRVRRGHRPQGLCGQRCPSVSAVVGGEELAIMVNSCTGKMGHAAAEAVVRGAGVQLVPYTMTGEPVANTKGNVVGVSSVPVSLVGNEEREEVLLKLKDDNPSLIIVDFTLPSAVNGNALLYAGLGIPFVMGTTGGDREKMMKDVVESGVYALIASNMGKQVVAFQAMMEMMAQNFPGAFAGYTLTVTESHQKTKVDTSGTAKDVVASFQRLGLDFDVSQVEKIRDPGQQVSRMGVPDGALTGHAYHTYHLVSPEGSVNFEFQHNVVGRSIYGEGTVDACCFLAQKIQEGAKQRVYDMVDVLRAGAMR